jgi:hypothetical protein
MTSAVAAAFAAALAAAPALLAAGLKVLAQWLDVPVGLDVVLADGLVLSAQPNTTLTIPATLMLVRRLVQWSAP